MLGAGILWFLYKGENMDEIKQVLDSGIRWPWIVLSFVFAVLSHVARAYRWQQQLRTLDCKASLNTLSNSVFGNYGVNLIFPRLGEVWRCNYIARREQMSFSVVLGSVVSERIFDVLCIGIISAATILIQIPFFASFFSEHETLAGSLSTLFLTPWLYLGLAVVVLVGWLCRKRVMQWRLTQKIVEFAKKLLEGIKTIQGLPNKWFFIFLTFGIWFLYFLNFYVCLFAFECTENVSLLGGLTCFVMGSLGIIVPVQGGTGPWHFMIISTLVLLGIGQTEASTFALVVHALQQVFVILLGLYAVAAIQIDNRSVVRNAAATSES